jgi:hypothetical protein
MAVYGSLNNSIFVFCSTIWVEPTDLWLAGAQALYESEKRQLEKEKVMK